MRVGLFYRLATGVQSLLTHPTELLGQTGVVLQHVVGDDELTRLVLGVDLVTFARARHLAAVAGAQRAPVAHTERLSLVGNGTRCPITYLGVARLEFGVIFGPVFAGTPAEFLQRAAICETNTRRVVVSDTGVSSTAGLLRLLFSVVFALELFAAAVVGLSLCLRFGGPAVRRAHDVVGPASDSVTAVWLAEGRAFFGHGGVPCVWNTFIAALRCSAGYSTGWGPANYLLVPLKE